MPSHDDAQADTKHASRVRLLRSLVADEGSLAPEHHADLRASGLTDETVRLHRFRSIRPKKIERLLGFSMKGLDSGVLIPFADPRGGFTDHIRVKVFPTLHDAKGHAIKYLQPRDSGVRLFFPLATLDQVVRGNAPVWIIEGEKKSLAVAQLGLPAVGFCGIEGWHAAGSRSLLPDFDCIRLRRRQIELVPDGDWQTNPNVARGAFRLAEALEARGASVRLVVLPAELPQ